MFLFQITWFSKLFVVWKLSLLILSPSIMVEYLVIAIPLASIYESLSMTDSIWYKSDIKKYFATDWLRYALHDVCMHCILPHCPLGDVFRYFEFVNFKHNSGGWYLEYQIKRLEMECVGGSIPPSPPPPKPKIKCMYRDLVKIFSFWNTVTHMFWSINTLHRTKKY